jgi:hypothetical protein
MHMSEGKRVFLLRHVALLTCCRELEGGAERFLRELQKLRRGGLIAADSGAQVSGTLNHAVGLRHQSV